VEQLIWEVKSTRPASLANKHRDRWFELRSILTILYGINKPMKPWKRYHLSTCSLSLPSSAGFTLAEVVIVTLLLGILAMLGLPTLNSAMVDSRLSAAVEEIVNALQYAQLTTMTSGRETRVVIGAPQDRVAVRHYKTNADLFGGGDELVAGDVESGTYELMQHPLNKGTDYEIILPDENRFRGVDITASDFNVAAPVYFDTLGAPSKGGTVTLALGDRQMVVTLDAMTGKVTVSN
jgi:prepilin-type N-terminal cleavage/methylation domain-containing protein